MTRPSRRTVLRAAVVVAGAVGLTGTVTSCARTPEGPDALESPLAAARRDAARAAAGATAFTSLAARLGPVADARRAHADALAAEVRRARPDRVQALDQAPAPDAPVGRDAGSTLRTLTRDLDAARDEVLALAPGATRYRCGLLTSVGAACAGLGETLA